MITARRRANGSYIGICCQDAYNGIRNMSLITGATRPSAGWRRHVGPPISGLQPGQRDSDRCRFAPLFDSAGEINLNNRPTAGISVFHLENYTIEHVETPRHAHMVTLPRCFCHTVTPYHGLGPPSRRTR